jgi:hypothetical protein
MEPDMVKWLLVGAVAGYVPLGSFIMFLILQLLKAKDKNTEIIEKATVHNQETNTLIIRLTTILDKVADLLGE